jgi:hypothetical protein
MSLARKRLLVLSAAAALPFCYIANAGAVPVTYTFSTDNAITAIDTDPIGGTPGGMNSALLAAFAGLTVTARSSTTATVP